MAKKSEKEYREKVKELNNKYPNLKAKFNISPWGGRFEIEVCSVEKAKILNELYPDYTFTSEFYR